jgi:hypothetical protein
MEAYVVQIGIETDAPWPDLNIAITHFLQDIQGVSNTKFRVTRVKVDGFTEFPLPTKGSPRSDRSL